MKKKYSIEIADCVERLLREDDWKHSFNEENGVFKFDLSIESRLRCVEYLIKIDDDFILMHCISPITADYRNEKEMRNLWTYFGLVNCGQNANGCFQMDPEDGEICFRVYIDCEKQLPSKEIIRNAICCAANMFEKYSDGMLAVIYESADPKEAKEMSTKKAKRRLLEMFHKFRQEELPEEQDLDEALESIFEDDDDDFFDDFEDFNDDDEDDDDGAENTQPAIDIKQNLFEDAGEDDV